MTSPEAPPGEEPAEGEPAEKRRPSWHLIFRLMLSPMAFLAPCFSCAAAVTATHALGPVAGLLGAVGGFVLGTGCIFFWYFVIVGHFKDDARKIIGDHLKHVLGEIPESKLWEWRNNRCSMGGLTGNQLDAWRTEV